MDMIKPTLATTSIAAAASISAEAVVYVLTGYVIGIITTYLIYRFDGKRKQHRP